MDHHSVQGPRQNREQSALLTLQTTAQQFGHLMVESLLRLWSTIPSQETTEYTRKIGDLGSRQDARQLASPEFVIFQTPLLAIGIRLEAAIPLMGSYLKT